MESEHPIIFRDIEVIWLFSVDLLNRIDNMERVIEKITKSKYCNAVLRYHSQEELGKEEIEIIRNDENSQRELLNSFADVDFDTLDIEYIENQNFSRFLLKEVEIKFSLSSESEYKKCKILLTISKLGVAIFTLWMKIEENLNSRQIAELQLIQTENLIPTKIKIPLEIMEEAKLLSKDFELRYNEAISNNRDYYLIEEDAINVLIHTLWFTLINAIKNKKHQTDSFEKFHSLIKKDLRYEVSCSFPIVLINATEPEYNNAFDILDRHPLQLYQILSHVYKYDYNLINPGALHNFFRRDFSERLDVAYFDSLGSVILIMSRQTITPKERLSFSLEVLTTIELLQIQRYYLGFLTDFLATPVSDMRPREISIAQSYLSDALEIHHSNITRDALARKRLEHGKDVMEIDEQFKVVKEKIELLGEALNRFSTLRSNFFQIIFAIIIGMVPIYSIFSNYFDPFLTFLFAIGITGLILVTFYAFSLINFRRREQKKIKKKKREKKEKKKEDKMEEQENNEQSN